MSEHSKLGFFDTVATAFLRRRLQSRRLRVAAVRGLTGISAGSGGRLQMDFDHSATAFAQVSPWLAAHASGIEAAPLPPADPLRVPSLSIVVMVVGSRGDVQPFIPIACRLAAHHRVRVATHREFRPMVEQAGLEFYPLGGNPHQLMEYIVKTGGSILPTRVDQLWEDVPKRRAMIAEIHTLNSVHQLHAVKARVIDVAFIWRTQRTTIFGSMDSSRIPWQLPCP